MLYMDFGDAFPLLKKGKKLSRSEWNSGVCIFIRFGFVMKESEKLQYRNYGEGIREYLVNQEQVYFPTVLCRLSLGSILYRRDSLALGQGGAKVARRSHKPKVVGSSPVPAPSIFFNHITPARVFSCSDDSTNAY